MSRLSRFNAIRNALKNHQFSLFESGRLQKEAFLAKTPLVKGPPKADFGSRCPQTAAVWLNPIFEDVDFFYCLKSAVGNRFSEIPESGFLANKPLFRASSPKNQHFPPKISFFGVNKFAVNIVNCQENMRFFENLDMSRLSIVNETLRFLLNIDTCIPPPF